MKPLKNLEKYKDSSRKELENQFRKLYLIPYRKNIIFDVVVSNACGWEHVSVVVIEGFFPIDYDTRIPTYEEMVYIKELFWDDDEICIQVHPKRSEYVNINEHCLHIWKRTGENYKDSLIIKDFIEKFPPNTTSFTHVTQLQLGSKKYCILSGANKWPTWNEVCEIKQQYFEAEEPAIQYNISKAVDLNDKYIIVLTTAPTELPSKLRV